jgi:hypothetical protein
MTVFSPEPHTLLTVTAPTSGGMPPWMEAWRAGAWPWPLGTTQPMNVSFTRAGSMLARRIASRMATAPRRGAGVVERPPMNLPMGVRQALTMTASRSLFTDASQGLDCLLPMSAASLRLRSFHTE